jgi:flavin reductase (DIM6/NTAB) family NADH-FMN oxidoreductase RutF
MSQVIEVEFNKLLYRPCIVVSTLSSNGVSKYGFCCEVEHDTLRNIRENEEFVVNLVDESFGPLMKDLARDLPYGVSEITESGLTETPSKMVKPPRIFESYAWIECKLKSIVELSPRVVWIFGEVLVSEAKRRRLCGERY